LVAATGCADNIGIEVRPPRDVEVAKVELFIGRKDPVCLVADNNDDGLDDPCPGVGPPAELASRNGDALPGAVFHVDHTDPFSTDVIDGVAEFLIVSTSEKLEALIAVGTSPDGAQNSVAIAFGLSLDNGPRRIVIDLEAAGPKLTRDDPPVETNVQVWPDASPDRADDSHACVGAEFRGRRVFVVPEGDRDCDQVELDAECDPFVHLAQRGIMQVSAEDASCTSKRTAANVEVCKIGAPVCDESIGTNACDNLLDICIGNPICSACPTLDNGCIIDKFQDDGSAFSKISCNVVLQRDGSGLLVPCSNVNDVPATLSGSCHDPVLSPIGDPGMFPSRLDVDTGSGQKMSLSAVPGDALGPCVFGLKHEGAFPDTPSTPAPFELWAKFIAGSREVLIPVIIEWAVLDQGVTCPEPAPNGVSASSCVFTIPLAGTDLVQACLGGG
jgi:hypothetical protein